MNVQLNQLKKRSLLLILAGLTITFGLVVKFAIMGNPLQAKEEKNLVEVLNGETLLSKDTQVSDDPATIVVKSKENRLLVLPPAEGYDLHVLKDGKEQELPTIKAEDFHQQDTLDLLGIGQSKETSETTASGTSETTSTEAQKEVESNVFAVQTKEDPAKANVYLQLVKDQEVTLVFRNVHTNVTVTATDVPSGDYQSLFQLMEQPKEKATDAAVAETTASSEPASATTETPEKKETALSGTPKKGEETYENVIVAETEKTKKSLKELIGQDYAPEDSLKTPKQFEELTKEASPVPAASSPVIIPDAKISVQTGTTTFDSDDAAGHDSSATNNLVRSFDQVIYKVSFSIQNTSLDTKYTDIRYRVVSELPNAVTVDDAGRSVANAEIANGTYQDLGGGAQSSSGVLESTISDTGKVFIPVVMNVFGAKNGIQLQPTLKLEIVDAVNKETGQTEAINEIYDSSVLPALNVPVTKVSSKPSVSVNLVKGQIKSGTPVFGTSNELTKAYDVGTVIKLQPLTGRATGDYCGATFPSGPITYQIKQKATYQDKNGTLQNLATSQYDPFALKASAIALLDRTTATWQKNGTVKEDQFNSNPLAIPHGKTEAIYTSEPASDMEKIGVYDSGSVSTTEASYTVDVTNQSYAGIYNPYTYLMTGARASSATDKAFSSNEFIYRLDSTKLQNLMDKELWNSYTASLYIDSISYDGTTTKSDSQLDYTKTRIPLGGYYSGFVAVADNLDSDIKDANVLIPTVDVDGSGWLGATGYGMVARGQNIFLMPRTTMDLGVHGDSSTIFVKWNTSSFKFDENRMNGLVEKTREAMAYRAGTYDGINAHYQPYRADVKYSFKYGVPKSAAYAKPNPVQLPGLDAANTEYTWYDTTAEALKNGEIGAMQIHSDFGEDQYGNTKYSDGNFKSVGLVPLKVIGQSGATATNGAANIALTSAEWYLNGKVVAKRAVPNPGNTATYNPSTFNADGTLNKRHTLTFNYSAQNAPNEVGETFFIKDFGITTKTDVEKSLYQSDETIKIKVNGVLQGNANKSYSSSLTTTLPKGISYTPGTSKDGQGNPLPEPTITTNADGTTALKWSFPNSSLKSGVEVNFESTSDFSKIAFNSSGVSSDLLVRTVGEMWETDNPTIKDTSREAIRTSRDNFSLQLIQQIILSKQADKTAIEVGENDPLGGDTSITYTVRIANGSADALPNVKWLDVLPYNGDSRGSVIHGGYTVESVAVTDPDDPSQATNAKISYTTSAANENANPNTISGWSTYTPGTSADAIKDAKAFLVSTDSLPSGQVLELTVKIRPKGQKAGDIYVNNSSMNSSVDMVVHSQVARTKVYGRALSGFVWEDKNKDGLFDIGEPRVKDIPVKLYRTSLEKPDKLSDQLVKEDLQGNKFIDANGDSLVKSDADGNYHFDNLPEGTYVAEFQIHDQVQRQEFQVTTPLVGTDEKINSKADQTTYRTPGYNGPTLADLPGAITSKDSTYHMDYLNLGIIRETLGEIYLYKYEEGTAVDKNGDGDPDLTEDDQLVEGTHALAGAEFELREKDSGEVVQKVVTDENGRIHFDKVPFGDYLLVETKAPEGYELIKKPIEVTIDAKNQIHYLFVADALATELPFTGSTDIMQGVLILSAALSLLGLIGFGLKYQWDEVKRKKAGGR